MSGMSEMRPIERLSMVLLGIVIVVFLILMGLRSCSDKSYSLPDAQPKAIMADSISAAKADTVFSAKTSKPVKHKRKAASSKSAVSSFERSHLDEPAD